MIYTQAYSVPLSRRPLIRSRCDICLGKHLWPVERQPFYGELSYWGVWVILTWYSSSYDKSASNICESRIWATIGQTPWSNPYSTWYHRYLEFPFQAVRAASKLGEYTLTDRGTWYSIGDDVTDNLEVFVSFESSQGHCHDVNMSSRQLALMMKMTPC